VPALRALRRAFPGHHAVLACPRVLEPFVRLAGVADEVLPTSGLEPVGWHGPAPELAVNLHGRGPESHRVLLELGPARLAAFGCPAAGVDGPVWDPAEHEVGRWCRLLTQSLGIPTDPSDLHLPAPEVPPAVTGAVVVHPGAAYPARRWPPERFAEVAGWARERGRPVVLTGSAEERPLALEVARGAGLPEESVLAGATGLLELAAVVASAELLVCGDTGVAHLASAYRTPSVVLFGPTPPAQWGPPTDGPHRVLWHGDGTRSPFAEEPDPALLVISAEEVLAAAEEVRRSGTSPVSA
jgi:hypothetical protein